MRKLTLHLFLLAFTAFFILNACKRRVPLTEEELEEMNNTGVMLDPSIMALGNFFGNVSSDEILIHAQDGPVIELMTPELKELLKLTERDQGFFIFNVHQIQTKVPEQFDSNLPFEQVKILNQKSVDMLLKVIQHFKQQGKTIYVLGTGFGGYVVQELMVREGTDVADKYLILGSRLDMPDLIWQSWSAGNTGGFINGITPFTGAPSTLTDAEKSINKVTAGFAYKRYTEELAKYNDLTMLTYGYGTMDEKMGALSQNEQALLITRQANILEIQGGHTEAIAELLDQGFEIAFGQE